MIKVEPDDLLRRPGIFPVSWIVCIVVLCALRINVILTGLIASVLGVVAYSWSSYAQRIGNSNKSPVARRALSIAGILLISLFATRAYFWMTWDPIGKVTDDGWGWFPLPDRVETFPGVPNGRDKVVVVRRTFAGLLVAEPPVPYFVFIHRVGESENSKNLVLRYFSSDKGATDAPKVSWETADAVSIAVGENNILEVTKLVTHYEGVSINYSLGTPLRPAALEFWQRPFW